MIIRGTPKDIENFICVNSIQSLSLQKQGFQPMYIDDKGVYYKKTKEIIEIMLEEYC